MKKYKPLYLVLFIVLAFGCKQNKTPTLFLVGDSTMANKEKLYLPERGWGQLLPTLFASDLIIENHAKNGRSTRSFIYQGRWDSVYSKMSKDDYVLIQFGHNDGSKKKTERYATPIEYEYNLRKFVMDTRQKNAIPILATPVVRRRFDENSQFYDTHGVYPVIVRKVAKDLNVPLVEMHGKSMQLLIETGSEKSKEIFLHIEPNIYDSLPNGLIDNTHFSEYGAIEIAKIAASEIQRNIPNLAVYLK